MAHHNHDSRLAEMANACSKVAQLRIAQIRRATGGTNNPEEQPVAYAVSVIDRVEGRALVFLPMP